MVDGVEFGQGSPFNMSLESLKRINDLLRHCSDYGVNFNWVGLKNNLLEVYKELLTCAKVSEEDLEALSTKWSKIDSVSCGFNKRGILVFGEDIPKLLTEFDFFVRKLIYKYGLSMARSEDPSRSLV